MKENYEKNIISQLKLSKNLDWFRFNTCMKIWQNLAVFYMANDFFLNDI